MQESKLGPDHPETLVTRNNLASAYIDRRTHRRMRSSCKRRRSRSGRRSSARDHPHTLNSRNNLAESYLDDGRTADAIKLHESTLKLMESKLGATTLTPARPASTSPATTPVRAGPRGHRALQHRAQGFGIDARARPPDTLTRPQRPCPGRAAAGHTAEAIKLHEETLKAREATLGATIPHTLNSRVNLAGAYLAAGRTAEALALYELTRQAP